MSNEFIKFYSDYIANVPPDIILIIVVLIILIFISFGFFSLLKVERYSAHLKHETVKINNSKELDLKTVGDSLKKLKPLLDEFKELLFEEKGNTQNCETILSEDNVFRAIGVDDAALEHYPGIFTALGIAGTFIGILYALVPIAGTGKLGESEMLVESLLKGAGTAFLTSIIGISCSLLFLILERKSIGTFKKNLYEFQMAINSKLTRVTTEGLLFEIKKSINISFMEELSGIRDALETMADDIGTAVSKSIADTLDSVAKVLDNSISIAGDSSQEIVNKVMSSIDGTLGKFSENLEKMEKSSNIQSDILEQFDNSVKNMAILAGKLEIIVPSMTEIAKSFEKSSLRLEKLPEALTGLTELQKEFTTVARQSIGLMNKNWKIERTRLTDLIESLQEQFTAFEEGIVNGLQTTMSKFDDELSRAGTYVATWLDRLNEDVINFTKQVGTFNSVVQNSSSDLQSIMLKFIQSLATQSTDMEANLASISSTLTNGFQEIETGIKQLPPEISKAVGGIEQIYKTATEQLPEIVSAYSENILKEIDAMTRKKNRFFGR